MSDQNVLSTEEFASAVEMLRQLLPDEELERRQPCGPATVYTTMVTLWMMILQRLGGGKTLNAVVKDVLSYSRALLPDNKRLREGTLSETSGAYSQARTRLKKETVEFFARRVSDSLIDASPPWFDGRRAFLLDGTTITLAPTEELKKAFPPATNQHGESVWPVALLLVVHELQSSCALPPEIGAMYGENNTSEAKLSQKISKRMPRGSIALADSAYGIFSVAHSMVVEGHDILFRLTKSRFKSLKHQATLLEKWDGHATWRLHWTPSDKDRRTNPDLPPDAALEVLLHEVPLENEPLYLVTTLRISSNRAGEFYARRYDVEHDIRDVKVTLDTENIRAKSVEMLHKELQTSIVAYNLVVQFRRQAAELAGLPPRRLSFTGVWNTFESFLLSQPPCSASEWTTRYEAALRIASRDKLPNRPGRSYPRRAHPRRPKSTKFMKQEAAKQKKKNENQPPEKPK
ncbi:MAG: IS4 family transposase [Planctomycetes bacterium]|nr:IS4 family transposase [Planctomycetota bacterium]